VSSHLPPDDFFAAPPVLSNPMPAGIPAPAASSRLGLRYLLMAGAALVVAAGAAFFWWMPANTPDMPISDPPPQGGSLEVPATLGGAPLSKLGTGDSWVSDTLPQYSSYDVLFEYYDARSTDHGLISVVALRGPVDDLPDRKTLVGDPKEWTTQEGVQCSPMYITNTVKEDLPVDLPEGPVKTDGHVCWQTSGDFSVSILTTHHDLEETRSLVNEFWATQ